MDKKERKALKRRIGSYTWALLIYYLIFNFAVIAAIGINLVWEGFHTVAAGGSWASFAAGLEDTMVRVVSGNGWGYLIACAIAVLLIRAWKGKDFFRAMYQPKQSMSRVSFLSLLCLILACQILTSLTATVLEGILNLFGLSIMEAMDAASVEVTTFSMFFYVGIAAPIVEEIIFRGMVMRGLEPYGKRFAILASALLFGAFHGNPIQWPYAVLVGLVLGYTAMEYSIWWAMVLHMANNLVLGDMVPRIAGDYGTVIQGLLIMAGTVGAIVVLVCRRKDITLYRRCDPIDRNSRKAFFTAVPNIIFFAIMAVAAISMLFQ